MLTLEEIDDLKAGAKVDYEEGDQCKDGKCSGLYEYREVEGCTCIFCPPCSACIENPLICSECEYRPDEKRWWGE